MKIRELKRKSGQTTFSAWPPQWGGFYSGADRFAHSEEGVLKEIKNGPGPRDITLVMEWDGREHVGILQWDGPPEPEKLEVLLRNQIGRAIQEVGDLDV